MTAEIALMNRTGVALAADSAVTIGGSGNKIYTSAEKLFQLSEVAPIGVMVYGNAEHAALRWETIIKAYRKRLGKRVYATLAEYCENFVFFLRDNPSVFPMDNRLLVMKDVVYRILCDTRDDVLDQMREKRKANLAASVPPIPRQELFDSIWPDAFTSLINHFKENPAIDGLDDSIIDQTKSSVGEYIKELARSAFRNFTLTEDAVGKLYEQAIEYLTHQNFGRLASGIVIAGFGEDDYMPALANFDVEQCVGIIPRRGEVNGVDITGSGRRSFVMPYAQQDSVFHFLLGVDTDISAVMENSATRMTNGLVDAILDKVGEADSGLAAAMRDQVKATVNESWRNFLMSGINSRQATFNRY
jgi:hypothetical protein